MKLYGYFTRHATNVVYVEGVPGAGGVATGVVPGVGVITGMGVGVGITPGVAVGAGVVPDVGAEAGILFVVGCAVADEMGVTVVLLGGVPVAVERL